jgi:hypothetical protein
MRYFNPLLEPSGVLLTLGRVLPSPLLHPWGSAPYPGKGPDPFAIPLSMEEACAHPFLILSLKKMPENALFD